MIFQNYNFKLFYILQLSVLLRLSMLIVLHGRNALQFCIQWLHYIGNKFTYSQISIIYPTSVYWIFQVIKGAPWFFTAWLSSYIPHIIFSLLYIFWCIWIYGYVCNNITIRVINTAIIFNRVLSSPCFIYLFWWQWDRLGSGTWGPLL